MSQSFDFMNPRSRYRGQVKPENLLFNANLQEFAQRVMLITNLETGGKISPEESYKEIKSLWKQLKHSKKSLGIGQPSPFDRGDAEAS
jgi:glutathione peroxidase-family protein